MNISYWKNDSQDTVELKLFDQPGQHFTETWKPGEVKAVPSQFDIGIAHPDRPMCVGAPQLKRVDASAYAAQSMQAESKPKPKPAPAAQ